LKDWQTDDDNKLLAGQDVLAARPTLLLALALESSTPADRQELLSLAQAAREQSKEQILERARALYSKCDVFGKAEKMIEKFRAKAEAVADEVNPGELRELLYYLVDTVLDRGSTADPSFAEPAVSLPLVAVK
jgi:geranylgeranyl pyrophosphate synthase